MKLLILLATFAASTQLQAFTHTGRFSIGAFSSSEKYKEAITGSTSNDAVLFSSRYYQKVIGLTSRESEFIVDFRDKHDLFDKVDNEKLKLQDKNTFQVRQLSYKHRTITLGRFPLSAAGGVHTDGASYTLNPYQNLNFTLFGGLNPKRTDQTYLEYNPDSKVFGGYSTYQINPKAWHNYFHLTNGVTVIREHSKNERAYLYHNLIYQITPTNRIMTMLYLDFIPSTYIQNMMLLHYYGWTKKLFTTSSVHIHDTTTYIRLQGVRERLDPSTYQEAKLKFKYKLLDPTTLKTSISYGQRELDNKTKIEFKAGGSHNITRNTIFNSFAGVRKNFDTNHGFFNLGATYYTKHLETDFNQELIYEIRKGEKDDFPTITTLSLTHLLSRSLITTASFQYSRDDKVDIVTFFLRAVLRFGNSGRGPIRGNL